jgi:hypothetical protein
VAAGLVLLAACGQGESPESVRGAPVLMEGLAGPGSPLPDGFTVAPGSYLVGPVLRTGTRVWFKGTPVPEEGWSALFLVDGDPYEVFDHYRAAAARAGVATGFNAPYQVCGGNEVSGFECRDSGGFSYAWDRPPDPGPNISMYLERHAANEHLPPASHLLLNFSRVLDPAGATAATPADPPGETTGPPAPPFPTDWPALWSPGDPIGANLSILADRKTLVVEPGTRLLAPPAPFTFCATGGFGAVFEVTGDPAAVVAGYDRQFRDAGFQRSTKAGMALPAGPAALYYASGGGELEARTISTPNGPTYLRLWRCND